MSLINGLTNDDIERFSYNNWESLIQGFTKEYAIYKIQLPEQKFKIICVFTHNNKRIVIEDGVWYENCKRTDFGKVVFQIINGKVNQF